MAWELSHFSQVSWWSGLAAPPPSAARFAARHPRGSGPGGLLCWPPVKEDLMEDPMDPENS